MGMGLSKLQELVMYREAWHAAIHGVAKSRIRLSDWTELNLFWPLAAVILHQISLRPFSKIGLLILEVIKPVA